MSAYKQLLKFLKKNEGNEMQVSIVAFNLVSHTNYTNWIIDGDTEFEINISDDNSVVTIINDEGILSYTDNQEKIVFGGSFELDTTHGSISFKLL